MVDLMAKTMKKKNKTVLEITTTTDDVVVEEDRAEIQTRIDHYNEDIVNIQTKIDAEQAKIDLLDS